MKHVKTARFVTGLFFLSIISQAIAMQPEDCALFDAVTAVSAGATKTAPTEIVTVLTDAVAAGVPEAAAAEVVGALGDVAADAGASSTAEIPAAIAAGVANREGGEAVLEVAKAAPKWTLAHLRSLVPSPSFNLKSYVDSLNGVIARVRPVTTSCITRAGGVATNGITVVKTFAVNHPYYTGVIAVSLVGTGYVVYYLVSKGGVYWTRVPATAVNAENVEATAVAQEPAAPSEQVEPAEAVADAVRVSWVHSIYNTITTGTVEQFNALVQRAHDVITWVGQNKIKSTAGLATTVGTAGAGIYLAHRAGMSVDDVKSGGQQAVGYVAGSTSTLASAARNFCRAHPHLAAAAVGTVALGSIAYRQREALKNAGQTLGGALYNVASPYAHFAGANERPLPNPPAGTEEARELPPVPQQEVGAQGSTSSSASTSFVAQPTGRTLAKPAPRTAATKPAASTALKPAGGTIAKPAAAVRPAAPEAPALSADAKFLLERIANAKATGSLRLQTTCKGKAQNISSDVNKAFDAYCVALKNKASDRDACYDKLVNLIKRDGVKK